VNSHIGRKLKLEIINLTSGVQHTFHLLCIYKSPPYPLICLFPEAINCLNQAIDIYTDMGRFTIAAKHHITIAEIYESELVDIEKAIAHYEQAADYYKGEESNRVAMSTMDNPLLKYNAKEYFFKASLCHFIVDELNAKLAIEKYEEMFPAFSDSRELKLLKVNYLFLFFFFNVTF
ncbi:beta-soluble NSF attachment protein-like, partial [Neolamprologus brichardi]|uniref:beta-soluble NSF attachment protein-like n=1 Tax=Neolamprologus brichardi TaxID=32507 RepID=UPI0003EBC841